MVAHSNEINLSAIILNMFVEFRRFVIQFFGVRQFPNSEAVMRLEKQQNVSKISDHERVEKTIPDQIVSYDDKLLDRTRTLWLRGEWEAITRLDIKNVENHPDRAKLSLLVVSARLQLGDSTVSMQCIRQAVDWGCSKKLVSQILISGVYNTLGRAAAVSSQEKRAIRYFQTSIATGAANSDVRLLTQARTGEQLRQLDLNCPEVYTKVGPAGTASGSVPQSLSPEITSDTTNEKFANISSGQYWEERYQKGGTSGYGSYGRLAEFKAQTINKFIADERVEHLIEFGCGDGAQLSMINIKSYVGVDISPTIIQVCKEKFKDDSGKTFYTNDEFKEAPQKAKLTLSLDVIFHLIEDHVFAEYMTLLFESAERNCIIYSCDEDWNAKDALHVSRRKFTEWIADNLKSWRLMQVTYNKYPHDGSRNPKDLSFSNFYFFERTN
jgi:hypothetical protein